MLALGFGNGYGGVAQAQGCSVGTRVYLEYGGGEGTIAEIGTVSPYVDWYRIVFSWSPRGQWHQGSEPLFIAGTKTRCGVPGQSPPAPQNQQPAQHQPNSQQPAPAAGKSAACPLVAPPGKVSSSAPASAALFKRVIYEWEAARITPGSVSAPKQVGLSFLSFQMGKPYKNTLTSKRFGDKRLHTGAPVNAMLYPLKTRELVCDLHGDQIRRTVTEVSRDCFKSKSNTWTCPGRITKYVESYLIPAR